MKTIEQTRRELFEDWFERDVWKEGCYGNPDILKRQLWPCWNAAMDAIVIELPGSFWPAESQHPCIEVPDILDTIESTNLGLKIR